MYKKIIIFCAEYLVVLEGGVLLLLAIQQTGLKEQLTVVFSGVMLLIVSLSSSKILKRVIHKARPSKELFIPYETYAFPSGHATGLASVSLFIFLFSVPLGFLASLVASFVVTARVLARVHDVKDIVAGLLLGCFVTYLLYEKVTEYVYFYFLPTFGF